MISPQRRRERKESLKLPFSLLMHRNLCAFAVALLIVLPACSKKEEVFNDKVQKVRKFAPENQVITEGKLEQWLLATERVGEFIRKFALEDEDVRSKDDFMFLAHSSPRTEAMLTSLFKSMELKQGEFWWILERFVDAGKYADIKAQEAGQNRRIDIILAAGREEKASTEKSLAKEMTEGGRKELERRLGIINAKFSELSTLKGNTTLEMVGVLQQNMELYSKNRERIEAAIKKMWKVRPGGKEEVPRDKSIPGH